MCATEIHKDTDGNWYTGESKAPEEYSNLLMTIGYSLGLGHSDDPMTLMFPYHHEEEMALRSDDLFGFHALHGLPEQNRFASIPATATPQPTPRKISPNKEFV
ncbi:hypothetical protein JTB14_002146 [Gonioctena quinquepunctata]|nr:hypothetical protein JTB14_002146 [Gonioctena quinquepunctata]